VEGHGFNRSGRARLQPRWKGTASAVPKGRRWSRGF